MNSFSYLRSIKPKHNYLLYSILISFVIIIISLFIFKSYDVYVTKGFVECDDKCSISIMVNYLSTSRINKVDMISINKENKYINNISVSEIMVDENNKSNYQIVTLEVDQLDNDILNTFQDVKLYSNKELIINKIIKVLL